MCRNGTHPSLLRSGLALTRASKLSLYKVIFRTDTVNGTFVLLARNFKIQEPQRVTTLYGCARKRI